MPEGVDPPPSQAAPLRAQARERLARELHDELAHRVASVSLQVMGHRGSDDPAQLRRALDTIAATTADILAHLWLLDRVLRAHPFDADRSSLGVGAGLPHLAVCEPVLALVEHQARALREEGFVVEVSAPDPAEDVGPLARRTLEEAVLLSRSMISRRAPAGARCTFEVGVAPGSASLRVTAPLPETTRSAQEADDPAMVALHERVRLTEGTLWVGHQDVHGGRVWSLTVRLRDR